MRLLPVIALSLFRPGLAAIWESNDDLSLAVFNATKLEQYERQWTSLRGRRLHVLLQRLGKIALFMRLYRKWIPSPNTGRADFERFFPEPRPSFHPDVYNNCLEDIVVRSVIDDVKAFRSASTTSTPPSRSACPRCSPPSNTSTPSRWSESCSSSTAPFSADELQRLISSNQQRFDVTIAYFFCWLTKNRVGFLERLPFSQFGPGDSRRRPFPADRFREFAHREEMLAETPEVLDDLFAMDAFESAERSFCPHPCCGLEAAAEQKCPHRSCATANVDGLCVLHAHMNKDMAGLVANSWNISCLCDEVGLVFRFDSERCEDLNECHFETCSREHEQCLNTIGGHRCICLPGYRRRPVDGLCAPVQLEQDVYEGVALD